MAEFNFFQLIPETGMVDPLNIKSEVKDELEFNGSCEMNSNNVGSTSDVVASNQGSSYAKRSRIVNLGMFSADTTSTSSSMSLQNEVGNRSHAHPNYYMRVPNAESSTQGRSELELLLNKGGDGKIIKRSYKTNGGFLPDTVRTILVHLIVKYEMDKALSTLSDDGLEKLEEFVITSSTMQNYADEIVRLFPSEKAETYFGGFKMVNGVRILANGKLWDHYNYIKSVLREQGVLEGRKFKKKQPEKLNVIGEETQKKLEWLQANVGPSSEVMKNWVETFDVRTEGHSDMKMKKISDYFKKYLGLRGQQGKDLILSDFNRLYKETPFDFTETWNAIKPHLITKLQQCKGIKTVEDKAYVHLLPSLTSEQQDGVIFFLLPYLVPCGRKKRRNDDQQETRKLTPSERRETFMFYVSTAEQVEPALEKKREELSRNRRILHPTVVAVGSLMRVTGAYVAVSDIKYEVSSLLNAFDLAFKIYHAAHCDYPESCHSLWLFIQKGIFDLHYPTDRASPYLHSLVGEVRRVIDSRTNS